jgi:hypothetical protein
VTKNTCPILTKNICQSVTAISLIELEGKLAGLGVRLFS